jgi:hypothetical protein
MFKLMSSDLCILVNDSLLALKQEVFDWIKKVW